MVYYIVICNIPQGTGGIYCVLHCSMLHPPGYWWYILCTTSSHVTSPREMVVYTVYFIVLCYIPEDTSGTSPRILVVYTLYYNFLCYITHGNSGVYGVIFRSMLHSRGYWWYKWCTLSFYFTSPRVLVVYITMYYIVSMILVVYDGLLQRFMSEHVYYIVLFYSPRVLVV